MAARTTGLQAYGLQLIRWFEDARTQLDDAELGCLVGMAAVLVAELAAELEPFDLEDAA